jgi:hypothetical protein
MSSGEDLRIIELTSISNQDAPKNNDGIPFLTLSFATKF